MIFIFLFYSLTEIVYQFKQFFFLNFDHLYTRSCAVTRDKSTFSCLLCILHLTFAVYLLCLRLLVHFCWVKVGRRFSCLLFSRIWEALNFSSLWCHMWAYGVWPGPCFIIPHRQTWLQPFTTVKGCWNLSKAFSEPTETIMSLHKSIVLLMCCKISIGLRFFNRSCLSETRTFVHDAWSFF